jgi:hypothetical protein
MSTRERERHAPPRERTREESRGGSSSSQPRTVDQAALGETGGAEQRKSDMGLEEAKSTAGKDGARNIQVKWIEVQLPHAVPCRFAVSTTTGNTLEVSMEQLSYRKSYSGTSSLQTDITPVAPNGTEGKLTVRDVTTGETLEQPWRWRTRGGGLSGLWQLLKRLFT